MKKQRTKETLAPQTTTDRQGFIHPVSIGGLLEQATMKLIVRDFDTAGLHTKEALLKKMVTEVMKGYPNSSFEFTVT